MTNEQIILKKMTEYYADDPERAQHFIKVYAYSKFIGEMEQLEKRPLEILCITALVHDIGIKAAEEKYGKSNGKLQEKEGPPLAREMLSSLLLDTDFIDRVCYLVGHHHTYTNITGMDYQILIEADFIVNMYEDKLSNNAIKTAYQNIFKTETGKSICKAMFAKAFA